MIDIATLGIEVITASMKAAGQEMKALVVTSGIVEAATKRVSAASVAMDGYYKRLTTTINSVGASVVGLGARLSVLARQGVSGIGAAFSRGAGSARMFALQLSQVGQMAAVTGNFVQALLIQIPDMAVGLGPLGIIIGSLVGLVGSVAYAWYSAEESGKTLREEINTMTESVSAAIDANEAYSVSQDELIEKFGTMAEVARVALGVISDIANSEAAAGIKAMVDSVAGGLLEDSVVGKFKTARTLAIDLGDASVKAIELQYALIALEDAQGVENQAIAAVKVLQIFDQIIAITGQLPPELESARQSLAAVAESGARLVGELQKGQSWTEQMAAAMKTVVSATMEADVAAGGLGSRLAAAAGAAWNIAAGMAAAEAAQHALTTEKAIAGYVSSGDATGLMGPDGARSQGWGGGKFTPVVSGAGMRIPKARGGGGGGGDTEKQFEKDLERLMEKLQSEEQVQMDSYLKDQEMLEQALNQKLITRQEYAALEEQLSREHQERMSEIDVGRYGTGLQKAGAFFGAMAEMLASGNEKMQKISRAFAATEALINTYRAAAQTLADPKLSFFAKFLAVARVVSAGMALVSAIRSGGSARISGGGGGRVNTQQTEAPEAPQRVIVEGLKPGDMVSYETLDNLYNNILKKDRKRGYVVQLA